MSEEQAKANVAIFNPDKPRFPGQFEAAVMESLRSRIADLEADLARVTAERDRLAEMVGAIRQLTGYRLILKRDTYGVLAKAERVIQGQRTVGMEAIRPTLEQAVAALAAKTGGEGKKI